MKFFKKALIATAILGSVGAQAATVSNSGLKLSAEGVMYKTPVTAQKLTFDIVVDKDHPSASTITLAFDSNVDLTSALTCAGSVTQGVSAGKAVCGDIGFDYGTGSFTFDNVVIKNGDATKGETDSISFDVNLGNPLYANSAFRIVLGQHDFDTTVTGTNRVLVKGESTLDYSSVDAAKVAIETGDGVIATEVSQYAYSVKTEFDGIIERTAGLQFNPVATDAFSYVLTNNLGLGLAITGSDTQVMLDGNFEDVNNFTTVTATVGSTVWSTSTGATETDTGTVTLTAAEHAAAPTTGTSAYSLSPVVTVTVDGTTSIPVTGMINSKAVVVDNAGNNATKDFPLGGLVIASNVDAGEWALDATIINVPYFPINYTATSTSVHIANEGSKNADVIVTAIDNNGTEYGPTNLGFEANAVTVTKISQGVIATLFGITDPTKLSVTFNIDADAEDVSAHAFSQNEKGRSEVSNSQLKGK
jgi:hypothetical protein